MKRNVCIIAFVALLMQFLTPPIFADGPVDLGYIRHPCEDNTGKFVLQFIGTGVAMGGGALQNLGWATASPLKVLSGSMLEYMGRDIVEKASNWLCWCTNEKTWVQKRDLEGYVMENVLVEVNYCKMWYVAAFGGTTRCYHPTSIPLVLHQAQAGQYVPCD